MFRWLKILLLTGVMAVGTLAMTSPADAQVRFYGGYYGGYRPYYGSYYRPYYRPYYAPYSYYSYRPYYYSYRPYYYGYRPSYYSYRPSYSYGWYW
jgi:hypothetical protein